MILVLFSLLVVVGRIKVEGEIIHVKMPIVWEKD